MEKRCRTKWEKLRDFLVDQSWNYFLNKTGEMPEDVKLLAGIIVSGAYDEDYLAGEVFWLHCTIIGLNSERVKGMIEICKRGYIAEKKDVYEM